MPQNPPTILLFRSYLERRFGQPLYRVPVDLKTGCPDSAACVFCADRGRAPINANLPLEEQVKKGIQFARRRYGAKAYLAYIQAETPTALNPDDLLSICRKVVRLGDFRAVYIASRPDCVSSDILKVLQELAKETEVWVELGVQSVNNDVLGKMGRGHDYSAVEEATAVLKNGKIRVVWHLLFGFPGETADDRRKAAEKVTELGVDGVKIHDLLVMKGSELAKDYTARSFEISSSMDHGEAVIDFLTRIPASIPVMRLRTDADDERVLAPKNRMAKGVFIDWVEEQMRCRGVRQGILLDREGNEDEDWLEPVVTEDGSVTFCSADFREHFHAAVGADTEARGKYVIAGELENALSKSSLRLLDICFGLGWNTLASCELASRLKKGRLEVVALEMNRHVVRSAARQVKAPKDSLLNWNDILTQLLRHSCAEGEYFSIRLLWGDARHQIQKVEGEFDRVYLDAFSPTRNPELWTLDFFQAIRSKMAKEGRLLTYCAALAVRGGLLRAGFDVGDTEAVGRTRGGTEARLEGEGVLHPLTPEEMGLLSGTRGLPYRDPDFRFSRKAILAERNERFRRVQKVGDSRET